MDEHPFIELIERHEAAINRVCHSFCSNADDQADLKQEILLNLWRGWKRYHSDYRVITWIYRVALNTAISWRRRSMRQVEALPIYEFDIPEDSILKEQTYHLKTLIALLPVGDQRLIQLYLDGFSSEEIGQIMGISQTNVTTRIGRIKEKLRKLNRL